MLLNHVLQQLSFISQNDIIGPTGFGEGHFISLDTILKYKIRFENDVNATAPAQKVLITSELDEDLDLTTLEFCSVGFGNHTFAEENCSPILQVSEILLRNLNSESQKYPYYL